MFIYMCVCTWQMIHFIRIPVCDCLLSLSHIHMHGGNIYILPIMDSDMKKKYQMVPVCT